MNQVFLKIINMSISASWLILIVLLVRFVLKKAPKWMNVFLWGVVAVRLICPFAIESPISLIPESVGNGGLVTEWLDDYVGNVSIIHDDSIYYDAVISTGREPISDGDGGYYVVTRDGQLEEPSTMQNAVLPVLSIIWTTGMLLLTLYTVISYLRLHHKVETAVRYRDNIFKNENINSPFVLGIIRPRIYLPFKTNAQDIEYIVAHEKAHISRKDNLWKPLGFFLLMIHWFNPLMWLAYVLLCRDIELACDEKVIKDLACEQRADYTQALVTYSVNPRRIAACPLAFGEVGVKERVKSVMNYKKPAWGMIALAIISCAVVGACSLTNPKQNTENKNSAGDNSGNVRKWFDYLENPDSMNWNSSLEIEIPELPNVIFRQSNVEKVELVKDEETAVLFSGMPIWNAFFCDLTGDGLPELCSTVCIGSGFADFHIIVYDYTKGVSYTLEERGVYDYTLRCDGKDGILYVDKKPYSSEKIVASGPLIFKDGCIQIEGE